MNAYRHLFHAGNFADVFKHIVLSRLILRLQGKKTPFLYLDTHSGAGRYDLTHAWAKKNSEFKLGADIILGATNYPDELKEYMHLLRSENLNGRLDSYPGSPVLARNLLRAQDRLVLNELNKNDNSELTVVAKNWSRTSVRMEDGFKLLNAALPPNERRGLIFIDPSFDQPNEFQRITDALRLGIKKFRTGVFAVWYPVINERVCDRFIAEIKKLIPGAALRLEIHLPRGAFLGRMHACGMLIINPPYLIDSDAGLVGNWLVDILVKNNRGTFKSEFI